MAARKSQSGLAGSLAERRRAQEAGLLSAEPWDVLKQRSIPALPLDAHYRAAELLSNDIAVALAAELEELDTYHRGFRAALHRVFVRVLRMSHEKTERVVLFHEAVPGYTLMLFKKDDWEAAQGVVLKSAPASSSGNGKASPDAATLDATAEGRAASVLMGEYVQRTGKRVIVIEHVDSLFLFFPAADLRKNVRELGYFAIE